MFEKEALIAKLKEKEMSVSELAEKIGINKATLYRKIAKKSDFTLAEIQKCAEIFGENSTEQIFLLKYEHKQQEADVDELDFKRS